MGNRNGRGELNPGIALRQIRFSLGFTLREVNAASVKVAQRKKNSRFTVAVTRLHDIETKKRVPSIHCLYTLSVVYRCPLHDILLLYGIY
jgi:hypothetical protein